MWCPKSVSVAIDYAVEVFLPENLLQRVQVHQSPTAAPLGCTTEFMPKPPPPWAAQPVSEHNRDCGWAIPAHWRTPPVLIFALNLPICWLMTFSEPHVAWGSSYQSTSFLTSSNTLELTHSSALFQQSWILDSLRAFFLYCNSLE